MNLLANVTYEWRIEWTDGKTTHVLARDQEQAERIANRKRLTHTDTPEIAPLPNIERVRLS